MDVPILTVRRGLDAQGAATVIVEVSVETRAAGELLLAIDLSDSSPVAEADLARLPRLLSPLPRTWRVTIVGLGAAAAEAAAARWEAPTVGDVIDGVIDLRTALLDAAVIARERAAGSFLAPVLERFTAAGARDDARLVAVVVTDGRLVDVDRVRVPERMRVLGLAPIQGTADGHRWSEIVAGAPFIGRDSERDAIGRLRAAAGCGFHGPCVVTIPDGEYRVRAANDAAGSGPTTERRRQWDFSLAGRMVLEFVGAALPDHLVVTGADDLEARLAVAMPAADAGAAAAPEPRPSSVAKAEAIEVPLAQDEPRAVLDRARELAASRTAWQATDGTLAIAPAGGALAGHLLDAAGMPRADAFVLIGRDADGPPAAADTGRLLLIPVRRDVRLEFPGGVNAAGGTPLPGGSPWTLHFDTRENRWMLAAADAPPTALPPRGSHLLPVDVRDGGGAACPVFFSGTFRAP